jgi:hypothetical protein
MPHPSGVNRRILLSCVLAVILAGEVSGLALAGRLPARQVNIVPVAAAPAAPRSTGSSTQNGDGAVAESRIRAELRPVTRVEPVKVAAKASPKASPAAKSKAQAPAYRGRNHVWIPTLGINRSVASFPCTRSRPPDNRVYRWGCAGRNNVYLLGHAYSVFKPLHDAYVRGRLKKGMKVFYADGAGHVRTYKVRWWRVTRPTASASWAWAAQSRPSMTLQTCLGTSSEFRLIVRLVAAG